MLQRLVLLGIFILSHSVFAMNGRTTYQAKIVKPNGYPLEAANVNFRFTVLDTVGSCILYVEDYAAVNMQDSGGLISFALGNGARSFPTSGTPQTFQSVFDNSVSSFSCQNAGIYNPISNDTRRVVMQFNDGTGWQTLPAMTINAVPYAMYADQANSARALNNKADTAFVEYATLASLNCNPATHAITFNGVSFSCIPVGSGGGGGGISSVTTSGSVLTTTGTASAPVIGIQAVSLSQDGYLTAVDYAEFKAKLSASSTQIINTLGYEPAKSVSLTSLSNTVAASFAAITSSQWETSGTTISYTAGNVGIGTSDPTALLSVAKILDSQSSAYNGISSNLDIDPSVSGGTRVWGIRTGVTISASSTGNLSSGNPSLTGIEGLVTHLGSGNINKVAAITAGVKNMASGTINEASALRVFAPSSPGLITNLYGLKIENLTTNATNKWAIYQAGSNINSYLEGNLGLGVLAPVTKLDVSGGIRISMESATCAVSYAGTLRYNSGAVEFCNGSTWAALGISGAGLQSFNGSTSATQTFAVGTAGPAPTFSTANGVHTLNIPLASAGTTTAGLISNADYISFANKLNATSAAVVTALGYTPADAVSVTMLASTVSNLTATAAASFAAITSSQWVTSGTGITYNNGNVGIGVSSPSSMLEVKDLTGNLDYNAVIKVVANRSNSERAVMETYTENSTGSDNFIFMTSSIASSAVASINSPPSILMQTFRSTPMVAGDYFGAYLARATDTTGSHFRDAAGLRFMTPDGTTTEFRIGLNSLAGSPGGGFGRAVLTGTNSGNIGVDMINPTAKLNIAAGTNSVAPLKFTSGTLLSSPQSGTVEYDGSKLYFTNALNVRRAIATNSAAGSFDDTSLITNTSGLITLAPNNSTGSVVVSATTESVNSSTGALVVKGGLGVSGNTNVAGTLSVSGALTTNTNLGVGTSNPAYSLHIKSAFPYLALEDTDNPNSSVGTITYHETQGMYYDANFNNDPATSGFHAFRADGATKNLMILQNNGNVGIGTTNANSNLEVFKTSSATTEMRVVNKDSTGRASLALENDITSAYIRFGGTSDPTATDRYANRLFLGTNAGSSGISFRTDQGNYLFYSQGIGGSGYESLRLERGGSNGDSRLGIGVGYNATNSGDYYNYVAPYNLTLGAYSTVSTRTIGVERNVHPSIFGGHHLGIYAGGAASGATNTNGGDLILNSGLSTGSGSSNIYLKTVKAGTSGATDNAATTKMTITGAGNVGIGTSTPSSDVPWPSPALDISGSRGTAIIRTTSVGGLSTLRMVGPTSGSDFHVNFADSTGNLTFAPNNGSISALTISSSGNVGIGATAPATRLEIAGRMRITDTVSSTGSNAVLELKRGANTNYVFTSNEAEGGHLNIRTDSSRHVILQNGGGTTGNVGIGTLTPSEKLDVAGSVKANEYLFSSNGTVGKKYYFSNTVTAGNMRPLASLYDIEGTIGYMIQIQSKTAGNSGTKTYLFQGGFSQLTTSWFKMAPLFVGRGHGESTNGFDLYVRRSSASQYTYEFAVAANTSNKNLVTTFTNLGTDGANPFTDISSSLEIAQSSSGTAYSNRNVYVQDNIGIGTDVATYRLQVNESSAVDSQAGFSNINGTVRVGARGSGNAFLYADSGKALELWSGGSQNMTLTASGNLGVNTQSPRGKFDVNGLLVSNKIAVSSTLSNWGANNIQAIQLGSGAVLWNWNQHSSNVNLGVNYYDDGVGNRRYINSGAMASSFDQGNGNFIWRNSVSGTADGIASFTDLMTLTASGNLGIGTTNPSHKLDVNGTIRGFGITDSSDIRLKESIQPLEQSLEKILQVDGVAYYWKDKSMPKKQIGFIAQQLETVFPELVETDNQGMKSVNYSHLVAPLVEAVKSLYSRVVAIEEQMRREVASLAQSKAEKSEVEQLKQENVEIKKQNEQLIKYLCAKDPQADFCN